MRRPETVSIDHVEKMLKIAIFHLDRFNDEHRKFSGRDLFAMEAYLTACLQAGGNVFYTLANPRRDIANPYANKVETWKARLEKERKEDFDFFFRMAHHHRGLAVHVSIVGTETVQSAISAHLLPYLQRAGPGDMLESRLIPGGNPGSAQTYVTIDKLRLDGADVIGACKKFLDLLNELVQHCKAAGC